MKYKVKVFNPEGEHVFNKIFTDIEKLDEYECLVDGYGGTFEVEEI